MHPTPPADCRACGTCCFSQLETYIRVTGMDWERLGVEAEHVAHFIGNRAYMKMVDGHCAALRPDPATGHYLCTLYAQRPQTCRDLARGSPACLGELALKGDRPARSLRMDLVLPAGDAVSFRPPLAAAG